MYRGGVRQGLVLILIPRLDSVRLKIKMAAINGKTRSTLTISRKNRGLWTVYENCSLMDKTLECWEDSQENTHRKILQFIACHLALLVSLVKFNPGELFFYLAHDQKSVPRFYSTKYLKCQKFCFMNNIISSSSSSLDFRE